MLFNIVADIAKLSLFIVCAYSLLGAYARRRRPQWTEHLTKRRLAVWGVLTLAVGGVKLIEDVVAQESGPVDEAILCFIRDHVPAALDGSFAVVTGTCWRPCAWVPSSPADQRGQRPESSKSRGRGATSLTVIRPAVGD